MHFRRASVHPKATDSRRTFFCSELIAKAYKVMGLLRHDVPSCLYLPGAFTDNSGLRLLSGAELGCEMKMKFTDSARSGDSET